MTVLSLEVRLDGFTKPVGILARGTGGELSFTYSTDHLKDPRLLPLSLSLPLTEVTYGDVKTRAYFSNLLQERDQPLQRVMDQHGIPASDVAGLLYHVGGDCAGSVSVLPQGAPPAKSPGNLETDYIPLSNEEVSEIVRALHLRQALPKELQDPSPLAGVQSKISLMYLRHSTEFAIAKPDSGAPTSHVLKVPDRNHPNDPDHENFALGLSHNCGIPAVDSRVHEFGGIKALITLRFDRVHNERTNLIHRIHQEDFAQALGLLSSLKYERHGVEGRRFNVEAIKTVLDQTHAPAHSRRIFLDLTIFDLLVGNCDGHAKNHALLYLGFFQHSRGVHPELAPRYDILPTRLDSQLTDEFSYSVGSAKHITDVNLDHLQSFMAALGIVGRPAQKRVLESALWRIVRKLEQHLEILASRGQKRFADLIATNMRELLPKLNFPVPRLAEVRDAYLISGGGWLSS